MRNQTNTGLIVGIVVGVLGLVGGGITALVVTTDDDDGGGSAPPGYFATAEAFVQAYNSAAAASDPGAFPLDDYVCAAHHDVITESLEDDTVQRDEVRLTVVAVTEQSDNTGVLTMSVHRRGGASELSVSTVRTAGRWKVCDSEFDVLR